MFEQKVSSHNPQHERKEHRKDSTRRRRTILQRFNLYLERLLRLLSFLQLSGELLIVQTKSIALSKANQISNKNEKSSIKKINP